MSQRIEKVGNYIKISDSVSDSISMRKAAGSVEYDYKDGRIFFFHANTKTATGSVEGYDDSDFVDSTDTPFVNVDALLSFLDTNTGFDAASESGAISGWGFYADDALVNQVVSITDSKLLINGLSVNSNEDYLTNGNGSIWDIDSNRLTPFEIGVSYDLRIQLNLLSASGNPAQMNFKLDIGSGATPSIVVMEQTITLKNSYPQSVIISTPIFCLETFFNNGGQLFMNTNAGTLSIGPRSILAVRTS